MSRTIYRFDDIDWHVPTGPGTDDGAARAAAERGVGRKFLSQGDAGFYAQVVRFPADFAAPPHSHDHAEVFVVLEGSCTFDGQPMARHDSTVVSADETYGFTAGGEGLTFLVVRNGPAAFQGA
jgi:mannose-6-phosphate isomerase-like protein (cupin superfamily)